MLRADIYSFLANLVDKKLKRVVLLKAWVSQKFRRILRVLRSRYLLSGYESLKVLICFFFCLFIKNF